MLIGISPKSRKSAKYCYRTLCCRLSKVQLQLGCVCSLHQTVLSTRRRPANPVFALILHPRDTRSVVTKPRHRQLRCTRQTAVVQCHATICIRHLSKGTKERQIHKKSNVPHNVYVSTAKGIVQVTRNVLSLKCEARGRLFVTRRLQYNICNPSSLEEPRDAVIVTLSLNLRTISIVYSYV